MGRRTLVRSLVVAVTALTTLTTAACSSLAPFEGPSRAGSSGPSNSPSRTPDNAPSEGPSSTPSERALEPDGTPTVVAEGLAAPWSILRLGASDSGSDNGSDNDSTLISERDRGTIRELTPGGELRTAGTIAGVAHSGESGLLGLASLRRGGTTWIYAYFTTASDNRIERMPLIGRPGSYSLGSPRPVLTGLAQALNHDGGRIAFGPDGMLYATVGDAGVSERAQDPSSLNGKILRMTPTGGVPPDNPMADSLVYSMGHRNPQGLAWDSTGQLFAAEFGQNRWDELNRIEPGGNYGWPTVEGKGGNSRFIDPVLQWPTSEASPSGLGYVGGTLFLAALKGERLWVIPPGATTALPFFVGTFGRLRDAVPGPNGTLWLLTNNTDGRGFPHSGDDKLLQVKLKGRP
ncbi:MAG: glucose dehydrogenase [Microbacteriaceae bacterium]|nr:glucose dehydrogenase [Microbacteriaceae bacterium]